MYQFSAIKLCMCREKSVCLYTSRAQAGHSGDITVRCYRNLIHKYGKKRSENMSLILSSYYHYIQFIVHFPHPRVDKSSPQMPPSVQTGFQGG